MARALVQEKLCRSLDEAFERFLKKGRPAWVPKFKISSAEAIALIHQAGRIAVLAHPGLNHTDEVIRISSRRAWTASSAFPHEALDLDDASVTWRCRQASAAGHGRIGLPRHEQGQAAHRHNQGAIQLRGASARAVPAGAPRSGA